MSMLFHVIGNVVFGILGNRTQTHRIFLFSGSLVLWGVVLFVIPSFIQYVPNMILGGMFGFISACQEAVHAVIIIDILGEDKMTDAYGILMIIYVDFCSATPNPFILSIVKSYGTS
jgi:MFS family permease